MKPWKGFRLPITVPVAWVILAEVYKKPTAFTCNNNIYSLDRANAEGAFTVITSDCNEKAKAEKRNALTYSGRKTYKVTNSTPVNSYFDDKGTRTTRRSREGSEFDEKFSSLPLCWLCCASSKPPSARDRPCGSSTLWVNLFIRRDSRVMQVEIGIYYGMGGPWRGEIDARNKEEESKGGFLRNA